MPEAEDARRRRGVNGGDGREPTFRNTPPDARTPRFEVPPLCEIGLTPHTDVEEVATMGSSLSMLLTPS